MPTSAHGVSRSSQYGENCAHNQKDEPEDEEQMGEREGGNEAREEEAEDDEDDSESDHEMYLILVKRGTGTARLRCAADIFGNFAGGAKEWFTMWRRRRGMIGVR